MTTLWLHLRAPFAAFRWMQAGVWRGTCPTIPYSAAWGLVLNLAGVETRVFEGGGTTLVRPDAPPLQLVVGEIVGAERAVLYQQLHSYPVGDTSEDLESGTHGAKYHILPVKRELLVGFDAVLGVRARDAALIDAIIEGLHGGGTVARYGLPFAGDNNLLFDRIDVLMSPPAARWYLPLDASATARSGSCRLTIGIDRSDSSRTTNGLFAPTEQACEEPPAEAWVWTPCNPG